jgi:predicted AAA+ superfamily ATPase
MHLKRKAYDRLLNWKKGSGGKTALLIDGARCVGKSYIAEELGKNEYKSFITINFSEVAQAVKEVFENDLEDLDLFFSKLSVLYGVVLHRRESLIIFDEVQCFPRARELIKFLVADGRFDYIETGTLLSIKKNVQGIVMPSEEEHFYLHPLDFEEFLWALGDETTVPFLKDRFEKLEPLGDALHNKVMNQFRQYMLIGGMPQAVVEYAESKDFAAADRTKKMMLDLYRKDISEHAEGYEAKVRAVFDLIPAQLSKKEKAFKITSLSKGARTRNYEDSFMWLADGMIINQCFNATDPTAGLSTHPDSASRKCYMADTGMLATHALADNDEEDDQFYRSILFDNLNVNGGMFMENIVAQMLRARGHRLFFYSRSDSINRANDIKIDFLVKRKNKICPVEVKSSSYTKHTSLDKFVGKFAGSIGQPYLLHTEDIAIKDNIVCIPIYMAMFL